MSSNRRRSQESTENLINNEAQYAKCCWCRRSTFRLLVYVVFLIGYICVGALCFQIIESPLEEDIRSSFRLKRSNFLQQHQCVSDDALEAFISEITNAINRGVSSLNNATVSESNWSFGPSIFFSTTVVTTVGYGRTAPLSEGGKLFCILFALIGIPLTLIMFTAIIERLMVLSHVVLDNLQRMLPQSASEFCVKMIYLSIVLFVHISVFTLIPAAIFDFIEEDWNYLDSVYFCIISWTTVGLGDFVPGEDHPQNLRSFYKICSSLYLFFSLISMLFLIKTFHDTPNLNLGLRIYMHSDKLSEEEIALRQGNQYRKYTQCLTEQNSASLHEGRTSTSSNGNEKKDTEFPETVGSQ